MRPTTTFLVCGYEFDTPALDQAGPGCPPGTTVPAVGAEVYFSAALAGGLLGVLAAALLLLARS